MEIISNRDNYGEGRETGPSRLIAYKVLIRVGDLSFNGLYPVIIGGKALFDNFYSRIFQHYELWVDTVSVSSDPFSPNYRLLPSERKSGLITYGQTHSGFEYSPLELLSYTAENNFLLTEVTLKIVRRAIINEKPVIIDTDKFIYPANVGLYDGWYGDAKYQRVSAFNYISPAYGKYGNQPVKVPLGVIRIPCNIVLNSHSAFTFDLNNLANLVDTTVLVSMEVTGGGTVGVNGQYFAGPVVNGLVSWIFGEYSIVWSGTAWDIIFSGDVLYSAAAETETPAGIVFEIVEGDGPAPDVAELSVETEHELFCEIGLKVSPWRQ